MEVLHLDRFRVVVLAEMSLALGPGTSVLGRSLAECWFHPVLGCFLCPEALPALLCCSCLSVDGKDVTPAGALRPCDTQTGGWGQNTAPKAMLNSALLGDIFLREPSSPGGTSGL